MTEILPPGGARRPAGRAAETAARRLAQPQAVRAVFCDVGFTLLAPHPSVTEIALRVCAERGLSVERGCLQRALPAAEARLREGVRAAPDTWANESAIAAIWSGYFAELLRPCLAGMPAGALAQTVETVRRAFDHHTSYALYPDVVPVLRTLHGRGLALGVISDWGVALGSILNEHGLNRYFDFAVVSAATRHAKPHPRLFELALERAGAIADYAVHVGDSYTQDVLGARSVGIAPVLIDRAGRVDAERVDVPVVRDLYGLLDLLEVEPDGIDDLGGG